MDLKVATDEGLEQDDEASLQSLKEAAAAIRTELSRVIVGQTSVVDELLIGEKVLAYDAAGDTCRWTPLLRTRIYKKQPTVALSSRPKTCRFPEAAVRRGK